MADVQKTAETPILLVLEDGTFVAVPQSLLMKESAVFRAQLNFPWQKETPENLEEKRIVGDITKQKGRYIIRFFFLFSQIILLNSKDTYYDYNLFSSSKSFL